MISVDKANVLAMGRLWRKVMNEIFEAEFPDLKVEHQLVDGAAMIMVKSPTQLNGVVLCSNLQGDILSDEASVIPGSKVQGIFEPIHGGFQSPTLPPIYKTPSPQVRITLANTHVFRVRARHQWPRNSQPDRHRPLRSHDAALLPEPPIRGQGRRECRPRRYRRWAEDEGHGREHEHRGGRRCHCWRARQGSQGVSETQTRKKNERKRWVVET